MKKTLKIEGMYCSGCASNIETFLRLKGYKIKLDFKSKKAECNIAKDEDVRKIIKDIKSLGYKVGIIKKGQE